jgi:hypothetical protein
MPMANLEKIKNRFCKGILYKTRKADTCELLSEVVYGYPLFLFCIFVISGYLYPEQKEASSNKTIQSNSY